MSDPDHSGHSLFTVHFTILMLITLGYGAYATVSIISLYLLFRNGPSYQARMKSLIYLALLFALATLWFIVEIQDFSRKLSDHVSTPPSRILTTVSTVSGMMVYLLSDGVLLYRLRTACSDSVTAVLCLTCLYAITLILGLAYVIIDLATLTFSNSIFATAVAFEVSTSTFNACTTFVIFRKALPLLKTSTQSPSPMVRTRLGHSMLVFIENGALYTIMGLIQAGMHIWEWIHGPNPLLILTQGSVYQIWQVMSFLGPAIVILSIILRIPPMEPPEKTIYDLLAQQSASPDTGLSPTQLPWSNPDYYPRSPTPRDAIAY